MKKTAMDYRYPSLRAQPSVRTIRSSNRLQLQPIESTDILPVHGTYKELLFDERWRKKRASILLRDGHKCIICSQIEGLQVHHRQYHFISSIKQFKPPWEYTNELLITLCKNCHNRGHNKYKVPTLSIK